MKIQLRIDRNLNQIQYLKKLFDLQTEEDWLEYPASIGKGRIVGYFFPGELSLYLYQSEWTRPVEFETINPPESGVYCLFINLSGEAIEKTIGEETHYISRYSPDSIFYYAPGNVIKQHVSLQSTRHFLVISFTRETFRMLLSASYLDQVLPRMRNFLFLDLDLDMEETIHRLGHSTPEVPFETLNKYQYTLTLLTKVFEKVRSRQESAGTEGLLEPEIEQLFRVRNHLLTHLDQSVPVKELAQMAGMSETKLKRYFPRLFGTSIHHYQQVARMEKAKELLALRRYNVSEVGFLVGYTNMTHFANAFTRQHGLKPRDFLKTIKSQAFIP